MFRPKSQQPSPDDLYAFLPEVKRAQLENSWAGTFRCEIMPMLGKVEADFSELYHLGMGAPNKAVAEILGMLILKDFHNYTDEQTIEAVHFNMQWQYALQLGLSQSSICQKTLHNFRDRMVKSQKHQHLFHEVTAQIIDHFGLDTSAQRMDSTQVVGAMKQLTRLGLFVKTIEAFLFKLLRMAQKDEKVALVVAKLPQKFHERYLDREGYFSDTRSSLASRRLDACAQDLWELIDRFRPDQKLSHLKQYKNMQRLFKEQCDYVPPSDPQDEVPKKVNAGQTPTSPPTQTICPKPSDGDPDPPSDQSPKQQVHTDPLGQPTPVKDTDAEVVLKAPEEIAATSLQSPSDEDATFGHKGKGYQFQLVETCVPTNPFQVITTTLLQGAHESDQTVTIPLLLTLEEQGHKPQVTFADSNYISGENILAAQDMGVDLQGPLPGDKPAPELLSLSNFTFDQKDQQVLVCPMGQVPLRHQDTRDQTGRAAYFDRKQCDACPLMQICPTYPNQTERRLWWTPEKLATARRRTQQESEAFKNDYKIRSGIEATISHEKNDHGLGHLRVRGRPAVDLAATFKTLTLNVKRAVNYALKIRKETLQAQKPVLAGVLAALFSRKPELGGFSKAFASLFRLPHPVLLYGR